MKDEIFKLKANYDISQSNIVTKEVVEKVKTKVYKEIPRDDNNLWLDKYKATKFHQLLTDEKLNRDLLTWLKSWDEIVFGIKKKPAAKPFIVNATNLTNNTKSANNFGNTNFNQFNNFKKEDEEISCERNRIILLAGPPGIGKTTLTKVLANHCGYDSLVVNASDERTSEKLLQRIYDATQLHNLNFSKNASKKPTCLILDEIDGIMDGEQGINIIKNILNYVNYGKINPGNKGSFVTKVKNTKKKDNEYNGYNKENKENKDNSDEEYEPVDNSSINEAKEKKASKFILRRPIICICNDLYAKPLKQLRKEALLFNIKKANPNKLLARLQEICQIENLSIDSMILKNLCSKSNFDIRNCINILQFISYNKLNANLINSISSDKLSVLGKKDMNENLFELWGKLFSSNNDGLKSYKDVVNLYFGYGESKIINDGIYANYTKILNKEKDFSSRSKLLEYLSYDDVLSKKMFKNSSYEASYYQSIPGAYCKKKYSTHEKISLEFPMFLIDLHKNRKSNLKIIAALKDSFDEEHFAVGLSKTAIVNDTLSFVYQFIQPNIREVNPEIMNKSEQKILSSAVCTMINFGIKFLENNDDESVYEPDIKKLLDFNYVENRFRLTEKQRYIIKSQYMLLQNLKESRKIMKGIDKLSVNGKDEKDTKDKTHDEMVKIPFGQKRKHEDVNNSEYRFIYKFNEGVTNSVRKTLNINYFWKEDFDYDDDEISPAARPPKNILSWNNTQIGTNILIVDDRKTAVFSNGGFRWARSNEEYLTGRQSFNLVFEKRDEKSNPQWVSYGVCWDPNMNFNSGTYYFPNCHMYCNYYPTITHGYNQQCNNPYKCSLNDILGVTLDFENKEIEFSINYKFVFKTALMNEDKPVFVVAGLFTGAIRII